jgi:tRNA (mo5U34)-methyltransferase
MNDDGRLAAWMRQHGLHAWAERAADTWQQSPDESPHGDWPRWQRAVAALPAAPAQPGGARTVSARSGVVVVPEAIGIEREAHGRHQIRDALMALHPWRKGPYELAGVFVDTEWRSDWKWDRLAPALESLQDRLVLDVGCGNGYHCWRAALAGARAVVGIDPTWLFFAQYLAVQRLVDAVDPGLGQRVRLLPVGIERVPLRLRLFDTVLSMGVLYHRRSPLDHLQALRGLLRAGGQLILETLVLEGRQRTLVPEGRYAKMRNVWFIPTPDLLVTWLRRLGFRQVEVVDVTPTSVEEQRASEWMRFESLADFLDPLDRSRTIEGHPAPVRAIVSAVA